ncbi:MAG: glycerophosphodiester phosphodiesterase [Gammaproteobacteria bacterium]|nr:MAG: glycerophosphodiester phosphodiesterase [Gammaproteobacteria bacterium]
MTNLQKMEQYKILGHRGAKAEVLENSQEGFVYAQSLIPQGLNGIEFDVQLTADNELVLTHDNTLDRICAHQGRIERLTAKYCQEVYQQGNAHALLTLPQVVPYLQGYTHIELELKTHQRMNKRKLVDSLADTYFSTDLQYMRIVLTSFDVQILEILQQHALFKNRPRGLIVQEPFNTSELINIVNRLQASSLGLKHILITPEIIELCHRYGIKVTAWTVNSVSIAQELIDIGVDTIITDYPSVFITALSKEFG